MTKKEMFVAIREVVVDNAEMVAFIDHELELLNNKSASRKPTKTQVENEQFKTDIVMALSMADEPLTISKIQSVNPSLENLSNQKMSHLLKALIEGGQVKKTYIKKVPYFSIVA